MNFAYKDFCWRHIAVKGAPAQAAGIGRRRMDRALNQSNDVVSKKDYLAALRRVIRQMHHCEAIHSRSVKVHEIFHGKTVWDGEVEV